MKAIRLTAILLTAVLLCSCENKNVEQPGIDTSFTCIGDEKLFPFFCIDTPLVTNPQDREYISSRRKML